jgi:dynein heavy chain
MGDITPQ